MPIPKLRLEDALGYADQALRQSCEASTLAQDQAHPYTVALAYNQRTQLHQFRRETHKTREWAEIMIAQATEQGSPHRIATGTIQLGWALTFQGQAAEGITRLRQGLAAYQAAGAAMDTPYFLGLLADAYGSIGQVDEGLVEVTEALGMVRNRQAFFWLFAIIWAESKSFHNRLISVFFGCVHFATRMPGAESA